MLFQIIYEIFVCGLVIILIVADLILRGRVGRDSINCRDIVACALIGQFINFIAGSQEECYRYCYREN